jgi:hypothetical protein
MLQPASDRRRGRDTEADADSLAAASEKPLPPAARLITQLPLGRAVNVDQQTLLSPHEFGPADGVEP